MKPIPRLEKKENKNLFCYFCKKFIETQNNTFDDIIKFKNCRCLERRNQKQTKSGGKKYGK